MMKCMLGVLAVAVSVAADEKKPDDAKAKLKGTWAVISLEIGGERMRAEAIKDAKLIFEGDKVTHEDKTGKKPAAYKIDASKKPAEMDVTPSEGPEKGKTMKMLYVLDGDMLKIAAGGPGAERPKGFDDKNIMVMMLKREKK